MPTANKIDPVSAFTNVPATDWETWVEDNEASILDVREPYEWTLGTLPGAILISQTEIVERMSELPGDRPVLCVCRSGGRSANVATFLSFNGFEAANMAGGMKALGLQD
ncbi:MAG TPA: rhodanese-like domain-containing protein [Acidimicrobiia bacterium]|nr:rhodanese-like domain-containing protein [Acidimicrobiia bacterium]